MASYGDEVDDDDDDFALPSTPHSVRFRNVTPPIKPRSNQSTSSSQTRQRMQQAPPNTQPLKRKLTTVSHEHGQRKTPTQSRSAALDEHNAIKPRRALPPSLKKPISKNPTPTSARSAPSAAPRDAASSSSNYRPAALSPWLDRATRKESSHGVIVLDSESDSEEHAVLKSPQKRRAAELTEVDLVSTQISGVRAFESPPPLAARRVSITTIVSQEQPQQLRQPSQPPQTPSSDGIKFTQESISSSQGSGDEVHEDPHALDDQDYDVDHLLYSQTSGDGHGDVQGHAHAYQARWSLSPDTTNPFLSDLVAVTLANTTNAIVSSSTHSATNLQTQASALTKSQALTYTSTLETDDSFAGTLDSGLTGYTFDPSLEPGETLECVVCGKVLAHLDRARIEYHINNCIDEQQDELQTLQSLDTESSLLRPSLSQGEFAGAQVDYLTRVKRCPICKLDWPLKSKGKGKATGSGSGSGSSSMVKQPKTARQKVEHMKRCAKANKRTAQSLLYQIRLLKERYERSLMLGTPLDSDPIGPSQEIHEDIEREVHEVPEKTAVESEKVAVARRTKLMAKTQVVSLAETADADFTSDAIITTVHAPAPSRPTKISKLQQLEQDQQDEGLQMALAISMSMEHPGSSSAPGSRSGSPFDPSSTTTWSLAPLPKGALRKGGRRRRQTEREKNETTVLPFVEVQHLIQANVQALLFPESEDVHGIHTEKAFYSDHEDEERRTDQSHRHLRTPPWRPSRFSETIKAGTGLSLSQTSEPDLISSPTKSLWKLSHLKDTQDVDSLHLTTAESHDDVPPLDSKALEVDKNGPHLTFDREKYVSRFMKRFLRRDKEDADKTGLPAPSDDPAVQSRSGSAQRLQDNKFSSPLWSASKHRRLSFRDHKEINQEAFSRALKGEIMDHLTVLEQQIQQAKVDAYNKILESMERHPVAAGLRAAEPTELLIIEDESEVEPDEEPIQEFDAYPEPSSPLLRYSRPSELLAESLSPIPHDPYSSQNAELFTDPLSPAQSPVLRGRSQDENPTQENYANVDENPFPDDQLYEPDNDYGLGLNDYGVMDDTAQSPVPMTSPVASLTAAPPVQSLFTGSQFKSSAVVSNPIDLDLLLSPEVSFTLASQEETSQATRRISSSSDILPPLDFAKLGYHNAASLTTSQATFESASSALARIESMQELRDHDARWGDLMTTPKRSKKRARERDEETDNDRGDSEGSEEETLIMPSRPKSVFKTRMGLPVPQQMQQQSKRGVLHGLPLLKTASTSVSAGSGATGSRTNAEADRDRDATMNFEDAPPSSQRATFQLSQQRPVSSNITPSTPSTPRRPAGRPKKNTSATAAAAAAAPEARGPVSEAIPPPPPPPPKTPGKKSTARLRAEMFAAETAKAVSRIREQRKMPEYEKMSVARLRLAATTFGLKSATKKKMLVDQLTSIWQSLNPNPAGGESEEEEAVVEIEGGNDVEGDRNEDVVAPFQYYHEDSQEEEIEMSAASQNLGQDLERSPECDVVPAVINNIVDDSEEDSGDKADTGASLRIRPRRMRRTRPPTMALLADVGSSQHSQLTMRGGMDLEPDLETYVGSGSGSGSGSGNKSRKWTGTSSSLRTAGSPEVVDLSPVVSDDDEEDGDEEDDIFSQAGLDDDDEEDLTSSQQEEQPVETTSTLERQLYEFLNKTDHIRRQFLTYRPLDLEQVWEESKASGILCTRQQLRQFLDKQGIVCIVPAHSTLGSWRKTRAKKRKRGGK